jgi:NAD(P)-dependent dehydrogenase (short-subunit alcohol dehydrogenase family)
MELGPEGIRVNAVCPTSVEGSRIDAVIAREAAHRGLSVEKVREVYLRQTSMRTFVSADDVADTILFLATSMRTFVSADDVADTILFLASDAARKVSGQSISVDGHTEGLSNWLD